MDLDNIKLNEISQTKNDKSCRFHPHKVPRIGKSIKTESGTEVTRDWEGRKKELLFNR